MTPCQSRNFYPMNVCKDRRQCIQTGLMESVAVKSLGHISHSKRDWLGCASICCCYLQEYYSAFLRVHVPGSPQTGCHRSTREQMRLLHKVCHPNRIRQYQSTKMIAATRSVVFWLSFVSQNSEQAAALPDEPQSCFEMALKRCYDSLEKEARLG